MNEKRVPPSSQKTFSGAPRPARMGADCRASVSDTYRCFCCAATRPAAMSPTKRSQACGRLMDCLDWDFEKYLANEDVTISWFDWVCGMLIGRGVTCTPPRAGRWRRQGIADGARINNKTAADQKRGKTVRSQKNNHELLNR